ncbi:MAG: sodium-dependent transporter [Muribaculaceae bacterium]|nr:sodium-dependent transporter [Muribaculaceae bacterium]
MSEKSQFASKIGLIAATVGSAVGLGNVWRFPAETQSNGGAAFLLLYIICVFVLGIPVMLAEFSLGRASRSDAIGAFKVLSPGKPWWCVGALAVLASFLILCYYMVVAGWTLEYLVESIGTGLYSHLDEAGGSSLHGAFAAKMQEYIATDIKPLMFTYAMIAINIVVLLGGVSKGIERLSNILMPVLFVILVLLCGVCLSLPGASAGVSYFLEPDFSKITPGVIVNALGQAFFSLSLGMGILITYASYYPSHTPLTRTSVIVSLLSLLVAVLMGLIIFPAVTAFGLDKEPLQGATLVFVTLPEVFANLPWPRLWSSLFFLLLFVAALTSTVSIAEVSVAMLQDRLRFSRRKAVLCVMLPLFALSALCSLSFGSLSDFKPAGMTIFDLLDTFTTDILLPVVSIGVCVYVGWFAKNKLLSEQLSNAGTLKARHTAVIMNIIRYVAPALIALVLIYNYL